MTSVSDDRTDLSSPGITQKIAASSLWMVAGKAVATLLAFVVTATLTRALGVYAYGELTTAFAFLVFFGVIADFGFFQILVREIARRPDDRETITNHILTMRILFGLIVYAGAALLVWLFPYSSVVKTGVVILSVAQFFLSLNNTLIGVFQASLRMDRAVLGELAGRSLLLGLVLWAVMAGRTDLWLIFALYGVANFVNFLISLAFVRRMIRLRLTYHQVAWRKILAETLPMGIVTMLIVLYFRIDTLLLSVMKTPVEVGIYGVPYKMLEILILLPGILTGNILPVVTQLIRTNRDRLRSLMQTAVEIYAILSLGSLAGIILLARPAIHLVAGQEFVEASALTLALPWGSQAITAVHLLGVLAFAMALSYFSHLWGIVVVSAGHQRALIRPTLIALLINLIGNLLLIPQGSYLAAAIMTVVTEGYICLAVGRLAVASIEFRLAGARLARIIIAVIIFAIVIWPVRSQPLILSLPLGIVVYLTALLLFRAIPPSVVSLLKRQIV